MTIEKRLLELEARLEQMDQRQFAMELIFAHALNLLEQHGVMPRHEFADQFSMQAREIKESGNPRREEELSLYEQTCEFLEAAIEHELDQQAKRAVRKNPFEDQ